MTKRLVRMRRALATWAALAAVTLAPALRSLKRPLVIRVRDGFRMPAEYAAHDGCWMIWPERTDNWRLGYVVFVARGVGRVRGDIEDLRRKLDAAGKR